VSLGRTGRRAVATLLLVLGSATVGWDLSRPPARQLSSRVLLSGVRAYRAGLSPVLRFMGVRCRFEPSCSRYAEASIAAHGAFVGSGRALWRLLRCGPWTPRGTVDPP